MTLFLVKRNNFSAKGHFFTKRDIIEGGHKVGNYQGQDGHCPPSMYVSLTPGRPDFTEDFTKDCEGEQYSSASEIYF